MNINLITIITAIVVFAITLYVINQSRMIENFTNDEAVQNIASLYNQSKFAVTDLTATGLSTLNNANINGILNIGGNGANINGTSTINVIKTNGITVNGLTNTTTLGVANGANINGLTNINSLTTGYNANIGTDVNVGNNLNVKGNTTLTGPLNAAGGIQSIVVDSAWDSNAFNQLMKPHFNRSMPDGTTKTFIFVHPNRSTIGNVNMRRIEAVKLGNQIVIFGYLDWVAANPWTNGSGDDQYRVNI